MPEKWGTEFPVWHFFCLVLTGIQSPPNFFESRAKLYFVERSFMSRGVLYYYEVSRIVKAPSHRKNTPSHCQSSLASPRLPRFAKIHRRIAKASSHRQGSLASQKYTVALPRLPRFAKTHPHIPKAPSHRKNTPSHSQGSLKSRKFIYIAKTFLHYENSCIVKVLLRSIAFLVPEDDSRVIFQWIIKSNATHDKILLKRICGILKCKPNIKTPRPNFGRGVRFLCLRIILSSGCRRLPADLPVCHPLPVRGLCLPGSCRRYPLR